MRKTIMEVKVEIVSKENIKPSSPTPESVKSHKLSFLDQFYPSIFIPMILYYPNRQTSPFSADQDFVVERSKKLKQALSETLTHFYPLAGRIKDSLSIDCNDEGALYVEARADSSLSEFLSNPNFKLLALFLPRAVGLTDSIAGTPVASVQVTNFSCGGFVVGASISHMIADGTAVSAFLKAWAATANGGREKEIPRPCFDGPIIFPQNESFPGEATMVGLCTPFLKKGNCGLRRFIIHSSTIAKLKTQVSSSGLKNPTRVEVVSAIVWKTLAGAINAKSGLQRPSLMTHAMNLRRRASPPYPESFMGDFICPFGSTCRAEKEDLATLAKKMREEVEKYNADFVKSIQGEKGFVKYTELLKEMSIGFSKAANSDEGLEYVGLSSWCNFGLYDVDFGWGRPAWASSVGGSNDEDPWFFNVAIFMDTGYKDEVELWIFMDEDELRFLDRNEDFLSYVSVNPSPMRPSF